MTGNAIALFLIYFMSFSTSMMGETTYVETNSESADSGVIVSVANADLDEFAVCLEEKGATFYGAFWCPHCQAQKALLGNSSSLPYVECSTPDGNGQTDTCKSAEIQSYPTWTFADGTTANGEQSLEDLAAKTGCELPAA